MHTFHAGRRGLLVGAVAVLISRAALAAAANDEAVIAPIQTLTNGLLQAMKAGPGVPFTQRYSMLAPVIEQTFDLPAVLEDSIGSTWATLPANQQSMLMDAFRRYTIATYVENFDNFRGQRFEISPETRTVGSEQVVQTKVVPQQGESHELDYVMRQTGPAGERSTCSPTARSAGSPCSARIFAACWHEVALRRWRTACGASRSICRMVRAKPQSAPTGNSGGDRGLSARGSDRCLKRSRPAWPAIRRRRAAAAAARSAGTGCGRWRAASRQVPSNTTSRQGSSPA